jgi:hypothetical protein
VTGGGGKGEGTGIGGTGISSAGVGCTSVCAIAVPREASITIELISNCLSIKTSRVGYYIEYIITYHLLIFKVARAGHKNF